MNRHDQTTMKEMELREHAVCSCCARLIGHSMVPSFWRVTVERWEIDLQAVRRQDGRAQAMGDNALLAQHMGPNEDMAHCKGEPVVLTICGNCASDPDAVLPLMIMVNKHERARSQPSDAMEEEGQTSGQREEVIESMITREEHPELSLLQDIPVDWIDEAVGRAESRGFVERARFLAQEAEGRRE